MVTKDECPHDLSGTSIANGLRRAREGERATHTSICPRCRGPVPAVKK